MGFQFHPELFEHKAEAIDALAAIGYNQFSEYASIDCEHDTFGIEVEGLTSQRTAQHALRTLQRRFPAWKNTNCFQDDRGFCIRISRDCEQRTRGF